MDYLASLKDNFYNAYSTYSLSKVKDSLDARFPRTGVRVSCPAVFVPFGASKAEAHDIVPGDLVSSSNSNMVYRISDCGGGWMQVCPEAHISYVNAVHKKLDNKVKPLVRFIKAWKYFRDVPISSFYLEMRVAKYATTETAIIYPIDVKRVLKLLFDCQLAAIQDPTGYSGYISACKTELMRTEALSKLDTALSRASNALEEQNKGNIYEAFAWWRLLYNDEFPSYY